MNKILLLDGQTIQALPAAKSFKKAGFYVVLFCDSNNSYGYHTRYADEKVIVPSSKDDPNGLHEKVVRYLSSNQVVAIVPMNDYSAMYLSKNKHTMEQLTKVMIPEYDVFIKGFDKNKLMGICLDNSFPHPKTVDLTTCSPTEAVAQLQLPALIKPNETTGARGFALINSADELESKLESIQKEYGDCHLQEFIPAGGNQYKVELFIWEEKLVNATVLHKIRFYPEKGGSSCFNQSVDRPNLVEVCFNVLRTIGWQGFADFDLIEDPRDGICKIMEINPRVPACIKASLTSNVDFFKNMADVAEGKNPQTYTFKPGSLLRYLGLDLLWFLHSDRRFKCKPSWFKGLLSKNHYYQDGGLDDICPFIFGTLGGIIKQMNPKFRSAKKGMN